MGKFFLYVVVTILVIWAMDSININGIFKKGKIFQARLLMAHLLENIVNSYVLQKEYSYNNLVELLKKGIINKTSL